MKKNIYIIIAIIIIAIIIIVIAGGWFAFSNNFWQPELTKNNSPSKSAEKTAVLVINDGEKTPQEFVMNFSEKTTAFDLLKTKVEELGLNLETKTYDIGIMIETIGDKINGQDGKYWLYHVNNEMPMVSADKMIIKSGDKVEFKFEKSPF